MKLVIKGSSSKDFEPDLMCFHISCSGFSKNDKTKSIKELSKKLKIVNDFIKSNFDNVTMETDSLYVRELYDQVSTKMNNVSYKQERVFKGYRAEQSIEFSTDLDIKLALQTIVSLSDDNINVHIVYTLKDFESCRNDVLTSAIDVAQSKAELIKNHLGMEDCYIDKIDYVNNDSLISSNLQMSSEMAFKRAGIDNLVNDMAELTKPSAITLTENVTVKFILIFKR